MQVTGHFHLHVNELLHEDGKRQKRCVKKLPHHNHDHDLETVPATVHSSLSAIKVEVLTSY